MPSFTKLIISLFFIFSICHAQSVIDDLQESSEFTADVPELVDEKIIKHSLSNKIFLISNDNQSFSKGDFVTLILENDLICRALVAKDVNNISGIKILKIYSLNLYKRLTPGTQVKVLRGDDSYFYKLMRKNKEDSGVSITDEEDLYNDTTLLEDNLDSLDENTNRAIKTDNIISLNLGRFNSVDVNGDIASYNQFQGSWAYQVEDNMWAEAVYGQNNIDNFPSDGLNTLVTNLTLRFKYTIKAPLYSFLQPYIGYQIIDADSPSAGEADTSSSSSPTVEELNDEIDAVENVKNKGIIFGVTLLKRLVPGWFFKADLGSDIVSAGFGLEF